MSNFYVSVHIIFYNVYLFTKEEIQIMIIYVHKTMFNQNHTITPQPHEDSQNSGKQCKVLVRMESTELSCSAGQSVK